MKSDIKNKTKMESPSKKPLRCVILGVCIFVCILFLRNSGKYQSEFGAVIVFQLVGENKGDFDSRNHHSKEE